MWSNAVIDMFNNLGFSCLFNNVNNDHKDMLTQRIKDQFIQQWHDVIANQPKMEYYRFFKKSFQYEKYWYPFTILYTGYRKCRFGGLYIAKFYYNLVLSALYNNRTRTLVCRKT